MYITRPKQTPTSNWKVALKERLAQNLFVHAADNPRLYCLFPVSDLFACLNSFFSDDTVLSLSQCLLVQKPNCESFWFIHPHLRKQPCNTKNYSVHCGKIKHPEMALWTARLPYVSGVPVLHNSWYICWQAKKKCLMLYHIGVLMLKLPECRNL